MTPAEIAATRRLIGLTVDQLAAELSVNPRTIRGWESGKYAPGDGIVDALSDLRIEHDETTGRLAVLAEDGVPIRLKRGGGWTLAVAARIIDAVPHAQIEWE